MNRWSPAVLERARATALTQCVLRFAGLVLAISLAACDGAVKVGSIGVVLGRQPDSGSVFVREVPPARRGSLLVGDELLMVDGRFVAHLDEAGLREALRGPVGSSMRLTIVREGVVVRVELARDPRGE
jgi:C-terminal processing protease CtpA/Prc